MDLALLSLQEDEEFALAEQARETEFGVCCEMRMQYQDPLLICSECGTAVMTDDSYNVDGKVARANTKINIRSGSGTRQIYGSRMLSAEERIAEGARLMHEALPSASGELIERASRLFGDAFALGGSIKQENKKSLMAACIYYCALQMGNYYDKTELAESFKLEVRGIASGEKRIRGLTIEGKLSINLDADVLEPMSRSFCTRAGQPQLSPLVCELSRMMVERCIHPEILNRKRVIVALLFITQELNLPRPDVSALIRTKPQLLAPHVSRLRRYVVAHREQLRMSVLASVIVATVVTHPETPKSLSKKRAADHLASADAASRIAAASSDASGGV